MLRLYKRFCTFPGIRVSLPDELENLLGPNLVFRGLDGYQTIHLFGSGLGK